MNDLRVLQMEHKTWGRLHEMEHHWNILRCFSKDLGSLVVDFPRVLYPATLLVLYCKMKHSASSLA